MRHVRQAVLSVALSALACTGVALAQAASGPLPAKAPAPAKPLPSPPADASAVLDGKSITVKYNAPSMRGRKIMGDLVPYGQVWRTGANAATTLITAADVKIGTIELPAGTYTLYTLPAAPGTPWQLIINKQTGQWGTVYKEDMDFGRTPLMSKPLATPQETMSISFEDVHGPTATLHIRWETTDEFVKVQVK